LSGARSPVCAKLTAINGASPISHIETLFSLAITKRFAIGGNIWQIIDADVLFKPRKALLLRLESNDTAYLLHQKNSVKPSEWFFLTAGFCHVSLERRWGRPLSDPPHETPCFDQRAFFVSERKHVA
jgi:hypothetical protein